MGFGVFNDLTPEQIAFVEGTLSNDEISTNKELIEFFVTADFTLEQAQKAVSLRQKFLNEILPSGYLLSEDV